MQNGLDTLLEHFPEAKVAELVSGFWVISVSVGRLSHIGSVAPLFGWCQSHIDILFCFLSPFSVTSMGTPPPQLSSQPPLCYDNTTVTSAKLQHNWVGYCFLYTKFHSCYALPRIGLGTWPGPLMETWDTSNSHYISNMHPNSSWGSTLSVDVVWVSFQEQFGLTWPLYEQVEELGLDGGCAPCGIWHSFTICFSSSEIQDLTPPELIIISSYISIHLVTLRQLVTYIVTMFIDEKINF